eukprot:m.39479 g.39479  ORF g.39479 m.39479 type:complete len:350 (+) comp13990_c0_seq1:57-1106(+)
MTEEVRQAFSSALLGVPSSAYPIPPTGKVYCVRSDASLTEAISKLDEFNFLAAPIRDVTVPADAPWHKKYMAVFDVVGVILTVLRVTQPALGGQDKPHSFLKQLFKEKAVQEMKVTDVIGNHRCCAFVPLDTSATLLDVMIVLGKYKVHRVALVQKDGDILNFITQKSVAQTFLQHAETFSSILKFTLEELGLNNETAVHSVSTKATVAEAFQLMQDKSLNAVGVTGEFGQLVATVSSRDVRMLLKTKALFSTLSLPVHKFLETLHEGRVNIGSPAIVCSGSDTVEDALAKMMAANIHRVFVCDEDRMPRRVVSLTDIFDKIIVVPPDWASRHSIDENGLNVFAPVAKN